MAGGPVEPACTTLVPSTPVLAPFWQAQALRAPQGELFWKMPLWPLWCPSWTKSPVWPGSSGVKSTPFCALQCMVCMFTSLFEQAATRL